MKFSGSGFYCSAHFCGVCFGLAEIDGYCSSCYEDYLKDKENKKENECKVANCNFPIVYKSVISDDDKYCSKHVCYAERCGYLKVGKYYCERHSNN